MGFIADERARMRDLGVQSEVPSMQVVTQQIVNFYELPSGDNYNKYQYEHAAIATQLGGVMAQRFTEAIVLPLLNQGNRLELIDVIPMRAGVWLHTPDRSLDQLARVANKYPEHFALNHVPFGVTRHSIPDSEALSYGMYYPNSLEYSANTAEQINNLLPARPGWQRLLRISDFGGATGESLSQLATTVAGALELPAEQVFIETVISSPTARKLYSGQIPESAGRLAIPRSNVSHLANASVNSKGWIDGIGYPGGPITPLVELGLRPKDWGDACSGNFQAGAEAHQYNMARLFERLQAVVSHNSDPTVSAQLEVGGYEQLRRYYGQRLAQAYNARKRAN